MTSSHSRISARVDTSVSSTPQDEEIFDSRAEVLDSSSLDLAPSLTATATVFPLPTRRIDSSITARPSTSPDAGICSDEMSPEVQAARAFFAEELPDAMTPEYFLQFWQHFQVMQDQVFAGSETAERVTWVNILRMVALDTVRSIPSVTSNELQLASHAALSQAYQILLTEYPSQADDLNAEIRINLQNWLPALSEPGVPEITRVQQFLAWFQSANESGLLPQFETEVQEYLNTVVSELQDAARTEETPEAALSHRLLALEILNAVVPTVAGFENIREDLSHQVAEAAQRMETSAEGAEDLQARLQLLSQAVTIWDALNQNPEDEFAADYRHATESLRNALNDDSLPLALRVQSLDELSVQIGQNGDEARSQEILLSLRSEADDLLETAHNTAEVEERIALLQDVATIDAQVGTAEEREAVAEEIRNILEQVEVSLSDTDHPEMLRAALEFLATNYLQIGDLEAAQSHLDQLRQSILQDSSLSAEAKGLSLVQLGSLYQQLAQARATAQGGEIDMSAFEQILSDLQGIGEVNNLPSMEAYAEWMQAVLAENPEAETLYVNLMSTGDAETDPYLALAQSIHAQIPGTETESEIPAWAPTIQFLSLLIEGSYEQTIATAEHDGGSSEAIISQRDQMRQMLRELQGFLASGRAATTEEAIRMLPTEEFFRLHLNEIIYSAVGMSAGLLIRAEMMEDLAMRNETYLILAREMMARDSSTHRADAAIVSMLSYVEQYEGPGVFDNSPDLWDFLAGNSTPAERAASTREWMGYSQAWRQVRNDLFTAEGGLIVLASLLTAGFAGEIAALGTAARFGFATLEEAPLFVRVAAGVNSFAANFAVYEGMHLGLTAGWRGLQGERQMTREEIRSSMISSAITFGTIGVFHASLGRMIAAPLMRAGASEFSLTAARYPITVAAMMTGEEIASATGVTPEDPSPIGVRLFRTVLMTLPFEAGSFAGRAAHEPLTEMARESFERTAARHRGTYETLVRRARHAREASARFGRSFAMQSAVLVMGAIGDGGGNRGPRPTRSITIDVRRLDRLDEVVREMLRRANEGNPETVYTARFNRVELRVTRGMTESEVEAAYFEGLTSLHNTPEAQTRRAFTAAEGEAHAQYVRHLEEITAARAGTPHRSETEVIAEIQSGARRRHRNEYAYAMGTLTHPDEIRIMAHYFDREQPGIARQNLRYFVEQDMFIRDGSRPAWLRAVNELDGVSGGSSGEPTRITITPEIRSEPSTGDGPYREGRVATPRSPSEFEGVLLDTYDNGGLLRVALERAQVVQGVSWPEGTKLEFWANGIIHSAQIPESMRDRPISYGRLRLLALNEDTNFDPGTILFLPDGRPSAARIAEIPDEAVLDQFAGIPLPAGTSVYWDYEGRVSVFVLYESFEIKTSDYDLPCIGMVILRPNRSIDQFTLARNYRIEGRTVRAGTTVRVD